ncbi:MAG: TetR/AcrR family transcriptional regulator, partial [Eubacteriales bacterium]|nr:TetR/AcrR family transcriptional regulator [Eubacteriales bacterium]
IDYIYDHFTEFQLLLDASYGTKFQSFMDKMIDLEVEYTYKYMAVIHCESVRSGLVTEEFLYMVVSAYFNGMFEVVRRRMDREAARRYTHMLSRYHMSGFQTIFFPEGDGEDR